MAQEKYNINIQSIVLLLYHYVTLEQSQGIVIPFTLALSIIMNYLAELTCSFRTAMPFFMKRNNIYRCISIN